MWDDGALLLCGFAAAVLVHVFATRVAKNLLRLPSGGQPPERAGFGRETYWTTLLNQVLVMPGLMWIAYRTSFKEYSMTEYLNLPLATLLANGHIYEQLYVLTLVGAQLRDLLPLPPGAPLTLVGHHIAVVLCCLLATFGPANGVLFVVGSFALEVGSGTYNLFSLWPSKATMVVYQVGIFSSNLVAFWLGIWMYHHSVLPAYLQHVYAFNIVALTAGRFQHAYYEWRVFAEARQKSDKD